jgi:hypothetical protein
LQAILEATKSPNRRSAIARLLQVEEGDSIELNTLAFEAGTTRQMIKKLAAGGLVRITEHADLGTLAADVPSQVIPAPHAPNAEQQAAIDAVRGRLDGGFSSNLLFGVTAAARPKSTCGASRRSSTPASRRSCSCRRSPSPRRPCGGSSNGSRASASSTRR